MVGLDSIALATVGLLGIGGPRGPPAKLINEFLQPSKQFSKAGREVARGVLGKVKL